MKNQQTQKKDAIDRWLASGTQTPLSVTLYGDPMVLTRRDYTPRYEIIFWDYAPDGRALGHPEPAGLYDRENNRSNFTGTMWLRGEGISDVTENEFSAFERAVKETIVRIIQDAAGNGDPLPNSEPCRPLYEPDLGETLEHWERRFILQANYWRSAAGACHPASEESRRLLLECATPQEAAEIDARRRWAEAQDTENSSLTELVRLIEDARIYAKYHHIGRTDPWTYMW